MKKKTTKTKKPSARAAKNTSKKNNPKKGEVVRAVSRGAESAMKAVKRAEKAVVAAVKSASKAKHISKAKAPAAGPKKQYLKSKPSVKVTFRLPHEAAPDAARVSLVGDFNAWQADATPMKRLRDGSFTAVVELQRSREYRFRYLIEGTRWENDWHADSYVKNAFGGEDSVVTV
jgi:hypothetical protein